MTLQERLDSLEKDFSPELNFYGQTLHSPGYHTRVPNGTWVHETRANMGYVHHLLSTAQPAQIERARGMLAALIDLQDQDPLNRTYGIWSWLVEEPLSQMSPPDWNWADFLGLKLTEILVDHSTLLSPHLLERTQGSLGHAARSIFRRNVQPGYTNIAVKGGCVTAAAGELLGEPWLVDYGQRRLQAVCEHFQEQGGFNEYNSPGYTKLVLGICETGLRTIRSETVRGHIEQIRRAAWSTLAEHFHPGTRQLCGPQSRAYSDFLDADWLGFLDARIGLAPAEIQSDGTPAPLCPSDLSERFQTLPASPLETKHSYIRRENDPATIGTTWFTEAACLGSVSSDITWVQRRPVLGYWHNEQGNPVALKLRILRDDQDFASGYVWNAQHGSRVLTASSFITGGGDFHPHLDLPPHGIVKLNELKIRYELKGEGVSARAWAENQFELSAGKWRAIIHTAPAHFEGQLLQWHAETENNLAFVETIIPFPAGQLEIKQLKDVVIVTALEVLESTQSEVMSLPQVEVHDSKLIAIWLSENENLQLTAPTLPLPEREALQFGNTEIIK